MKKFALAALLVCVGLVGCDSKSTSSSGSGAATSSASASATPSATK